MVTSGWEKALYNGWGTRIRTFFYGFESLLDIGWFWVVCA